METGTAILDLPVRVTILKDSKLKYGKFNIHCYEFAYAHKLNTS